MYRRPPIEVVGLAEGVTPYADRAWMYRPIEDTIRSGLIPQVFGQPSTEYRDESMSAEQSFAVRGSVVLAPSIRSDVHLQW